MGANILVVEDDEGLSRFIELELIHDGYTVTKIPITKAGRSV